MDLIEYIKKTEREVAELEEILEKKRFVLQDARAANQSGSGQVPVNGTQTTPRIASKPDTGAVPLDKLIQAAEGLPRQIRRLLSYEKRNMRVAEISEMLAKFGVTSEGEKGLAPSVAGALNRRTDWFVRVERGLYGLKPKEVPVGHAA